MADEDKISDDELALVQSLVGRTITRAHRWNDDESGMGGGVVLWLDDGRLIEIDGWGHDWWGADVSEITAASAERRFGEPATKSARGESV